MSNTEEIKKYPVFYNGEEYEIRIEQPYYISSYWYNRKEYVTIYKVTKRKTLFGRIKIEYEKVYEETKKSLIFNYTTDNDGNKIMIKSKDIDVSSDDSYIQLFKKAFNLYKDKLKREKEIEEEQERKLAALQEWDGVIE